MESLCVDTTFNLVPAGTVGSFTTASPNLMDNQRGLFFGNEL